jgi:hypothetical protein
MAQYTVKIHVFVCELYVKCGSARMCLRKFWCKLTEAMCATGIHKLIKETKSTGSLLGKKSI